MDEVVMTMESHEKPNLRLVNNEPVDPLAIYAERAFDISGDETVEFLHFMRTVGHQVLDELFLELGIGPNDPKALDKLRRTLRPVPSVQPPLSEHDLSVQLRPPDA